MRKRERGGGEKERGRRSKWRKRGGLSKWVRRKARERVHTPPLRSQWTDSSSHGWSECVVEF